MSSQRLVGTVAEVAPQILPWAKAAQAEVQARAKARTIGPRVVWRLLEALERGEPYGVFLDWGGGVARSYRYRAESSVFLGAFYRVGNRVRVAMTVGRYGVNGYTDSWSIFRSAYYALTECFGSSPPEDERLQARALVQPEWAARLARLEQRRHSRRRLEELEISQGLIRSILKAIPGEIFPSYLRVWQEGGQEVALYKREQEYWFFVDGEAHRVDRETGKLATRLLVRERRRQGLVQAARMALVLAGLSCPGE